MRQVFFAIKGFALALLLGGAAVAETVRSSTYEATAERRAVAMQSTSGASIRASQVLVTVRRLDGRAVTDAALPFAEKVACGAAEPMVSLALAQTAEGLQYDILCRAKG